MAMKVIFAAFFLFVSSEANPLIKTTISPNFTTLGLKQSGLFQSDSDCMSSYLCPDTKSKMIPDWDKDNCQCDDACSVYGDCCVNAKFYRPEATRAARHLWKCISMVQYRGTYMRTTCPPTWPNANIREKCEKGGVLQDGHPETTDPLSMTPVTSLETRFTYQNYYCAYCSGDAERSIFWTLRVECDDLLYYDDKLVNKTEEFVWSELKYNNETQHWGIYLSPNLRLRTLNGPPEPPEGYIRDENFVSCRVVVQQPVNVEDVVRNCKSWIDDCPDQWNNQTVANLCHSYTAITYGQGEAYRGYRNVHCAICNGEDLSQLNCKNGLLYRNVNPGSFSPSFAYLFDVNTNNGKTVGTTNRCDGDEKIYDPFFKMCRQMVCANSSYSIENGRCVLKKQEVPTTTTTTTTTTTKAKPLSPAATTPTTTTTSTTSSPNTTSNEVPTNNINEVPNDKGSNVVVSTIKTTETHNKQNETIEETTHKEPTLATPIGSDCVRFNISDLHYRILENGSVYIEKYTLSYAPNEYIATADGSILICSPVKPNDSNNYYVSKFSSTISYLSVACLCVSSICLILHLVAVAMVKVLRNLAGINLAALSFCLLASNAAFLVSTFQENVSKFACGALAIFIYSCLISSFLWMNCIAFDVWRTLRVATKELRVTTGLQFNKFICYLLYVCFVTCVMVAVSIAVENSTNVPFDYKPRFGEVTCWFSNRYALLIFFVTPVGCIMIFNIFMFSMSAYIISKTTRNNSAILNPKSQETNDFKLYGRLAIVMGISWTLGLVAGFIDWEPFWYLFVVISSLQGVFIFFAFTFRRKVGVHIQGKLFDVKMNNGRHPHKIELEGRDSGSGESQSSQTSHLSLSKTGSQASQVSKTSTDTLY